MTEVDVALTDYILFLESAWFAISAHRSSSRSDLSTFLTITFAGFAAASFLGGTTHGFFNDQADTLHALLWWSTMASIGLTATGFALTGLTLLGPSPLYHGKRIVVAAFVIYLLTITFQREFLIAIIFYTPATLLCMAGFITANRRWAGQGISVGTAGILISLIAPAIQQLQLSIHPVYFTYNAVYHVILMFALLLFYKGAVAALGCERGLE